MKRLLLFALAFFALPGLKLEAQCANDNTLLMSYSPICDGSPHVATNCIMGGQYVAVAVTAGSVYVFTTCGNTAFDSQITIYNSTGGGSLGYNDDNCGLQSTVTWTATFTGTLWVLVDQYSCTTNAVCIPLSVTCTAPLPPSSTCLSPIPDICTTACNLGTLPTPPPCVSGGTISTGATATFNMSNVGAIAENPYSTVVGCANPATDVWYRFQATGTQLVLLLTSSAGNPLNNPNISLYNGNNCNALLPLACFTGSGGTLSQTYSPITPNDYYYLQISGGNAADVGDFTLAIHNNYDCDNCLLQEDLQVTPPPVNGTYAAGQTVQFCFTVSNYNQTAANWLHGIDLNFGPGWNLATLSATTIPASCTVTTGAHWGFYNSVTGGYSGVTYGPGFWYETSSGGPLDGNPGNNFGDQAVGIACPRTFCWQITTQPPGACTSGASLAVAINTLGDSESGSWSSPGCTNDPIVNFLATLACCAQPVITVTNTTCGLTDGKIVAAGQGSAPWHYVWANAGGTVIANHSSINGADSIMNLASGDYSLTVTDNLGCSVGSSITVNASNTGATVASNGGPYCVGQTIAFNSTGGGTGYSWSGPGGFTSAQQTPSIANSTVAMDGTYNVTVTFGVGCTATASTVVAVNAAPAAAITPATVSICSGANATLTATGGTGYAWSNAANSAAITVSPTINTTYTVTVTDANSCTASASRLVSINPPPVASITPATVTICNGGSATITASGGGTYAWSNAASTAAITVSPTSTTTYTVTVTNASTCTATASRTVTVNSLPVAAIVPATVAICNGGSATLTASGGTTYAWSNAASSAAITVSPTVNTTYTVTVTDANTCTATASRLVTVNALPIAAISPSTVTICNGGNTTLTASGGTGYTWSNAANTVAISVSPSSTTSYSVTVTDANTCTATSSATVTVVPTMLLSAVPVNVNCNGGATGGVNLTVSSGQSPYGFLWNTAATAQSPSNIPAGTYTVTVTDNALCTATATATVTEPTPFSISEVHANEACGGATPGAIDVTNSGGVPPYTYLWNDGVTSQDRLNIAGGNYSLTVTDSHSCTGSITVVITSGSAITLSETHTNAQCFGDNNGAIILNASGATGPYTFSWNDGVTTQNRTSVVAGTYSVTVMDAATCSASLSVNISEPASFNVSIVHTNVPCHGGNAGTITITPSGGSSPYTFSWNDGNTSQNRNLVAAGSYAVTVTDSHGCTFSISATVTEPLALSVAPSHTNVLCNGTNTGTINLNVNGGNGPYTYLWGDGNTLQNRTNLSASTYVVTVTDNNTCSVSVAVFLLEPGPLAVSETHNNVLCNGANTGSITVTANGGTTPLGFMWNDGVITQNRTNLAGGNYAITVTDNNACSASVAATIAEPTALNLIETQVNVLCNGGSTGSINITATGGTLPYVYLWNDGIATEDRNGIVANAYSVTVTDGNSCSGSISATITEPTALVISETHVDVACSGGNTGSIDVTVSGAVSPYTFLWNDGVTTEDRANISQGNYSVTVSDNNSCSVVLPVVIGSTSGLLISETHTGVTCNGFSDAAINVTVAGGALPYTYMWNDGITTQNRTAIPAGNYAVSATDNNSCVVTLSVSIVQPTALAVTETQVNVLCNGGSSGSIDVTVGGASSPYTYLWNDGLTTQDRNAIAAGPYAVTVSDNNACTASASVTITEPALLSISENHTDALCNGGSSATIIVTATGGTLPFTYVWNDAVTSKDRNNIPAGNYSVVVSDNNSCTASLSVTIAEPTAVTASETHGNVSCNGGRDGSISVTPSGGTAPYSYVWNNYAASLNPMNLPAGNYSITASDVNSCSASISIVLTEPAAIVVADVQANVTCKGYSDGAITISVSGGTSPYTYLWNDAMITQNRLNLAAGNYTITVSDNNLCTATSGITVTEPSGMTLASSFVNPSCETLAPDGSITLNVSGGSLPYQYSWSNGTAAPNLSNVGPGSYVVTVADMNNCTVGANFTLAYLYDFSVQATPSVSINFADNTTIGYVLTGVVGNYVSVWSPASSLSCTDCVNPVASPTATTVYHIQVTNDAGCSAFDNVTVSVVPDYTVFLPNAFSPNGDGNNDVFEIFGNIKSIEFLEIQIFDRWGEKVFESEDHHFTWDGSYKGQVENPGIYTYTLKLTFLNGHREELRKGTLTLLR